MDCEKLSPKALKIFKQIKTYFPLDPWSKPQWVKEGGLYNNGRYDLRKKNDRQRLIKWHEGLIGSTIVLFARSARDSGNKLTRSVFHFKGCKKWIELTILLYELDFQIETLDFID